MASIERERTVHAIVLRRRDAGDSDRRLTLLTREEGVIDVYAKGAKKSGSRLSGVSEPLSASILHLATGKASLFLTQAQPITSFPKLRTDFDRLSCALALSELYIAAIPTGELAEEAFESLLASLRYFEVHDQPFVVLSWAGVRLLKACGFMPQLDACVITGHKMRESEPLISPMAGGFVSSGAASRFPDGYRTKAEVVYGMEKLAKEPRPPVHLKFAAETVEALYNHWSGVAERKLPAYESVVQGIMVGRQ